MNSDAQARFAAAERFIRSREFFGVKLGIENIRDYLTALGSPQESFPTIHVAGTNGKGSTVAMLGSIYRHAGYKTGVFTSPHLVDFRERIRVNGRKVSAAFVARFIDEQRLEIKRREITYFETMVALAFAYFAHCRVDIAVVETGLGGRLDATNTLTPLISVITEISRDHTTILGETLPKIAAEKGGIIKPRVPLALAQMPRTAETRLRAIARKQHAPIIKPAPKERVTRLAPELALTGAHQSDNLRTVLAVVERLRRDGFPVTDRALQTGLRSVRWPGRFQLLRGPRGGVILLDVAHNETGIRALVDTFQQRYPNQLAQTIVGFVKKKDHKRQFQSLHRITESYLLTPLPTRRSEDPAALRRLLNNNAPQAAICRSPRAAFRQGLRRLASGKIILIVGSHYLVGEFLRLRPQLLRRTTRSN